MTRQVENHVQIAKRSLDALLKAGADKAQVGLTVSERHEMNIETGELSLLRTTFNNSLHLTAIKQARLGQIGLNQFDSASVEKAVEDVMDIANGAKPDDGHDISEWQPSREFYRGPEKPDLDAMYDRMKSFIATVQQRHPRVVLRQIILSFTRSSSYLLNSNGVNFRTFKGTGLAMKDLDRELIDCGTVDMLLKQSSEQIETYPVKGKFVGDVIVAPDCSNFLYGFLTGMLGDGAIISGTSVYKDKVGELIASPILSLHSRPVSEEIADGYFVTGDGYEAKDSTIVDQGVLKGLLLSLYGSRKTGKERAANGGGAFVVDPGDRSFSDLIKSVKRGVLMDRFSGGAPSKNGDFSGIAKNSYLIEDGEIKYPISESMISGNFVEAFKNITGISRERVDYGYAILPWVAVSGLTISGK
jgi:PmbA protein